MCFPSQELLFFLSVTTEHHPVSKVEQHMHLTLCVSEVWACVAQGLQTEIVVFAGTLMSSEARALFQAPVALGRFSRVQVTAPCRLPAATTSESRMPGPWLLLH